MFFDKKLSSKVIYSLKSNLANFRVIIQCSTLLDKAESKLIRYKCKVFYKIESLNCICALVTPFALKRLIEFPFVKYVDTDSYAFITQTLHSQNESATDLPRYVKSSGNNIGIGIVSTGIYPHANLKVPKDKIRLSLDLINGFETPYDDNGHGTFLAGLISSKPRPTGYTFSGIAPDSYVCSVKAFDVTGKGFVSASLLALDTLISLQDSLKVRIILLPFEVYDNNGFILNLFSKLFNKATEKNIIIIVPSGNNGNIQGSLIGISTLKNCLTIGGLDSSSMVSKIYNLSSAAIDNKSGKPDFILPCTNIKSTNSNIFFIPEIDGNKIFPRPLDMPYTLMNGTCLCAAYACGLCAIILEKFPELSFNDIYTLFKHASHLIDSPKYLQGNGYVDSKELFSNVFLPKNDD